MIQFPSMNFMWVLLVQIQMVYQEGKTEHTAGALFESRNLIYTEKHLMRKLTTAAVSTSEIEIFQSSFQFLNLSSISKKPLKILSLNYRKQS